ncbi:MAG: DUF4114 domain-containing protein [Synechococcaceae bacterium WB7_1C_051]|nr:DUF4114 domain-containing protein [Synechococcaceae bacterium WB7_1C_051]
MTSSYTFKPLGPAPIQDPFIARLNRANPWGSGKATGAINTIFLVQDETSKDGTLYAGAAGGGVWGRPYKGTTDEWGEWEWLSSASGYEGAQSISKIKVFTGNKWLVAAQGATSSFGKLQGSIDKPLQIAERLADGKLKWIPNLLNIQDKITGKAITALETADDLLIIGTSNGLHITSINSNGELSTVETASNLNGLTNSNITSIARGESGNIYAAVLGKGVYTSTISELKTNPAKEWELIPSSEALSLNKIMLRVATSKDPSTGKDILYLATGINKPAQKFKGYDSINRVIYDESNSQLTWQNADIYGKIGNNQVELHSSFAADPTDPNRVFAGGNWGPGEWDPDEKEWVYTAFGYTGGIVATVFSNSEIKFENYFSYKNDDGTKVINETTGAPHADSRNIIFLKTADETTRIIESDDGGIYIKDLDETKPWKGLNDGLRTTEGFSSDWSNIGNLAITAMQDNATAVGRFGNQPGWLNVTGGDGAIARFDDGFIGSDGISRAYFASQQYGASGIVEQNSYDSKGLLLSSDVLNLSIVDKFGNDQDWYEYENQWYGAARYPFYYPAETSDIRAGDVVLSGMRNIYEQVIPHWQSVTLGEMILVPLIAEDAVPSKARKFTEVVIGSNKAFEFTNQKPYSWDTLYASYFQTQKDQSGNNITTAKLYGRQASTGKNENWIKNRDNYQLKDLSANLPKIVQNNAITGITFNPDNPNQIWATIASSSVAFHAPNPVGDEIFKNPSYLIYSNDAAKTWEVITESGKNGIPESASLQQVVYTPATSNRGAELYLGGYGGIWYAPIEANRKISSFSPVRWQGVEEKGNFNMWNTNLEYDPVDDVIIASIMAQGAWLLSRSNKELEPRQNIEPGLRITNAILPQNISNLRDRKNRDIKGSLEVSLNRNEENKHKNVSVELVLPTNYANYINITVANQIVKDRVTLDFPAGVNELSIDISTVMSNASIPDKSLQFKLENANNSTIVDNTSNIFLYATEEIITLNQEVSGEVSGVFYANLTQTEINNGLPSQAKQLSILMPRSNLNAGDQLFWFPVNSDGSINNGTNADGTPKVLMPKEPGYANLAKTKSNHLATSNQSLDTRAFSPTQATIAFSNPAAILSSEGISIGDLSSSTNTTIVGTDRFALGLQNSKGNVRLSTLGFDIDPYLNNVVAIGEPDYGSQVVLAPAEGALFIVDEVIYYGPSNATLSSVEFNLDVASFGRFNSGYGIFRVDNTLGEFLVGEDKLLETPLKPGDIEYAKEAFKRSQSNSLDGITGLPIPGFAQSNQSTISLAKGNSYGLYITPNKIIKSPDQITDLSQILFSIKNANQNQQLQHVSMGTGYFAFEDMGFAGDRDFNDMLFAITPKNQSIIG